MATIKWRLKGKWLKNCNCNPGCPCDFWAPPTHHKCEGMLGMHVDEGFYGKTSMKGVNVPRPVPLAGSAPRGQRDGPPDPRRPLVAAATRGGPADPAQQRGQRR